MSVHFEIFQVVDETIADIVSGAATAAETIEELEEYNEELPQDQKIVLDVSYVGPALASFLALKVPTPIATFLLSEKIGTVVGEDLGMGPAKHLSPKDVKALAEHTSKVHFDKAYQGLTIEALNKYYQTAGTKAIEATVDESPDEVESLKEAFVLFKEFLVTTMEMKRGLLVVVR
jgi:hypothetical protein